MPAPIKLLMQDAEIFLELEMGILIQSVEVRHCNLRSKSVLAQNNTENSIRGKFIRIIVIEIRDKDLLDSLHYPTYLLYIGASI